MIHNFIPTNQSVSFRVWGRAEVEHTFPVFSSCFSRRLTLSRSGQPPDLKKYMDKELQRCYVFKSRLQEYAQKVGLTIPVYDTIKEGPSHEPKFRSTVIVNDVRYDSLPGFFNRKASEHSAAEVALIELAKLEEGDRSITMPVHQTGLCKNLLQEYAQKMNFAMPSYECRKEEKSGPRHLFSCTVDVGGIKYIGATASTKKEAEIKAARTALLAIRSNDSDPNDNLDGNSTYTVLPSKKNGTASGSSSTQEASALKPKKGKFKKNPRRNRRAGPRGPTQAPDALLPVHGNGGQASDPGGVLSQEAIIMNLEEDERPTVNGKEGNTHSSDGAFSLHHKIGYNVSGGQVTACGDVAWSHDGEIASSSYGYPVAEMNNITAGVEAAVACLVNNPLLQCVWEK